LHLRVAEAPLDPRQALRVNIEGSPALNLAAPLPAELWLEHAGSTWALATEAPDAPFRLHTPGGANQLYDGEPLLIVYGTRGDAGRAACRRQRRQSQHQRQLAPGRARRWRRRGVLQPEPVRGAERQGGQRSHG